MHRTTLATAMFVLLGGLFANPVSVQADHLCTPALARNARLLERIACDLKDHIDEEYANHPWSAHLCQTSGALHDAAHRFSDSVANRSPVEFLSDDIAEVCQSHQQLARLLRATGVVACVQADMNRLGALIERIERQLAPVTIQPFPPVQRVPTYLPPVGRIPSQPFPGQPFLGQPVPGQVYPGDVLPGQPLPVDPRQGRGVIVPAPAVRNGSNGPSLYLAPGRNGRPEVGMQLGNVRLSFTR